MKKIRGTIALMIALGIAALAAYAVYGYLEKPRAVQAKKTDAKPPPEKKEPEAPKSMAQRIEPGMRAVTLMVDAVSGLSRELLPGDRVDVIAVTPIPGNSEGRISRLLMLAAEIMDVETADKKGGKSSRKWTVTLKVTPEEASVLATADPASMLRLVLRNPDDDPEGENDSEIPSATAFAPGRGVQTYSPQERDLNIMIAEGMRGITLEVEPIDGVGGIFRPGDRVDVVVTCPWGEVKQLSSTKEDGSRPAIDTKTHRNSRIFLQDIRIIATDESLAWNADINQFARRVTLEVTPEDAEKLTVMADSQKGKTFVRLISRNQNDRKLVQTPGADLMDLITKRTPYKKVVEIRGRKTRENVFYH